MLDIIIDALWDAIYIFPFVFLIYVLMEMLESASNKERIERALSGNYAPFFISLTGIVPECGFSVMCAKLYDSGFIGIGTLISAFIATSDEGLVVLLSNMSSSATVIQLVLWKIIYATFIGVLLNLLLKRFSVSHNCPKANDCIECGEHHEGFIDKYISHPYCHAVKIFIYIIIVNLCFNTLFSLLGEENILSFVSANEIYQPLLSSLVGLIPNCASSIILSQAFIKGALSFAGLLAGLSANAGMGLVILFRKGKNIKKGLVIIIALYISAVLAGYLAILGSTF